MKKIALIAAMGLLASGVAFAQGKDPKVVACQKAFHEEHNLIMSTFQKAKQDGKISGQEEAEFRRIENSISKARTDASKDGVTLQECEGIVAMAKKQHAALDEMIKGDAKSCLAEYKKIAAANDKAIQDGKAAKKVSGNELADYNKRDAELQKQYDAMTKDKRVTMAECTPLLAAVKKEAELVKEILAVNGRVRACYGEFKKVSAEADKTIEDGIKAKKVSPAEQAAYKTRDKALQAKYDNAMKGTLQQKECDDLLVEAKNELTAAKKMAAK